MKRWTMKEEAFTRKQWENSILSLTDAAKMLGVSRQRVHILLQTGQLEGFKVGNTWIVYRKSVENRQNA